MTPPRPAARILDAATELLFEEGVHVSVNTVVAKADVALRTVYRHFKGKDELIAAALELWSARWIYWLRDEVERCGEDPQTRFDGLCRALEGWLASEAFRGSLITLASVELRNRNDHPAKKVLAAHRMELRQLLADLACAAGAANPERLAGQLEILIEGAIAIVLMTGDSRAVVATLRPLASAALAVSSSAADEPPAT